MDAIDRGERYTPAHQDIEHDQHGPRPLPESEYKDPFEDLPQVKEAPMADKPSAGGVPDIVADADRIMRRAAQRMQERAGKAAPALREAMTADEMFTAIVNPDRARALGIRPDAPPPPSPERAAQLEAASAAHLDRTFGKDGAPPQLTVDEQVAALKRRMQEGEVRVSGSGDTKDAPQPKKLRARIDDYGL
jgi:hypothetical protein